MYDYVSKAAESFLTELADLMEKHGVEISSNADAVDDTGLQSWLTIERIIVSEHGRRTEEDIASFEYLIPDEIRNAIS